jgi:hypothetical protein
MFPWRSHGVAEPSLCARQMAEAFIINPLLAPSSDCLNRYATLKFKIE